MLGKIIKGVSCYVLVIIVTAAGCGVGATGEGARTGKRVKVGVILPDSKSSARWETADRRFLESAFRSAGVDFNIQNAQGDRQTFRADADKMIADGVNVLMVVSQDSETSRSVLDRARSQGVETIDYERLTLGGSASYHVSFDGEQVGRLLGQGLVRCAGDRGPTRPVVAQLNGATTDHNTTLFRNGYDSVLRPLYTAGKYVKGPEGWVPQWDNAKAVTVFERMYEADPRINAVLAANDGLGNAAISVLRRHGRAGSVPVTGQDATVQGLQNILRGDQCMTVYKPIRREADAAAELAISLARGGPARTRQTIWDPVGRRRVPAVLLPAMAVYRENVKDVVADGFVTKSELCMGDLAARCAQAGIR